MRWSELEHRQPRLAAKARERLVEPGVLLVVSLRRDGTPRLSPVEPYVMDGRLLLSMLWGSHKARDLERDPRFHRLKPLIEVVDADLQKLALAQRW